MSAQIRVGDIGTTIQSTIKDQDGVAIDVSGATTKEYKFEKPDGTNITRTVSFVTDGTDGQVKYVFQSAELNLQGTWKYLAHIITATAEWNTDAKTFRVYEVEV